MPQTLTEADSAEWAIIARYGGVPHPSGYPLYALICRLAGLLSIWLDIPVIWAIALASAVCGAAATGIMAAALGRLGYNSPTAVLAALVVSFSGAVWRQANTAEPFALTLLLAASVLWVAAYADSLRGQSMVGAQRALGPAVKVGATEVTTGRRCSGRPGWAAFGVGTLFGLGLCNHHSLVFLTPVGAVALWRLARLKAHDAHDQASAGRLGEANWRVLGSSLARVVGTSAAGFACGLMPLLYLAWARFAPSPYDYYPLHTWRGLVRLLLRTTYGTFKLANRDSPANWSSVAYYFGQLPGWLSPAFAVVAALGVGSIVVKVVFWLRRRREGEALKAAWLASFFFASLIFLRMFNVELAGVSWLFSVIERFMALPTFLLACPVAEGLRLVCFWGGQIGRRISTDTQKSTNSWTLWSRRALERSLGLVAVMALLTTVLVHRQVQADFADRSRVAETFYEDHVRAVFRMTPLAGDVLITVSDAESLGAMYGRYILGLGGVDLLWLNAAHWANSGHRQRTARRFGLPMAAANLSLTEFVARLVEQRGRALVMDEPLPPLPALFTHSFLLGPGRVLVRSGDALPPLTVIWQLNEAFFRNSEVPACPERAMLTPWNLALFKKYADNLYALTQAFTAAGRDDLAAQANAVFTQIGPCE